MSKENEQDLLKAFRSERDWPEDFMQENGNYQNECCKCGNLFMGYKRRVVCKVCAGKENLKTPHTLSDIMFAHINDKPKDFGFGGALQERMYTASSVVDIAKEYAALELKDYIEGMIPAEDEIKYKGVWNPQEVTERVRGNIDFQSAERLLKAWAFETVVETIKNKFKLK